MGVSTDLAMLSNSSCRDILGGIFNGTCGNEGAAEVVGGVSKGFRGRRALVLRHGAQRRPAGDVRRKPRQPLLERRRRVQPQGVAVHGHHLALPAPHNSTNRIVNVEINGISVQPL
jgi:hypothetical protein